MENFGKTAVFPANMAGLGKYHTGGYGRIGVYRVIHDDCVMFLNDYLHTCFLP